MQSLGFFTYRARLNLGFTLLELLLCMGILGVLAAFAAPNWQRFSERSRVASARDQLINDLQAARMHALQRGEALQLSRLEGCNWASAASDDWSCGWQLSIKSNATPLRTTQQTSTLQVTFAKKDPLDISSRGDLGTVGDRWVIKSRNPALDIANTLCLSSAGRVRWQAGDSCS